MKFLEKYLLLLFLIANMTSEYKLLAPASKVLFYAVLALSVPFLLRKEVFSAAARRKFPELSAMMLIYLIAQFVFQLDLLSVPNVLYTISKVAVFAILMLCIGNNFEYYFRKSLSVFPYVILGLVALGWVYNRVGELGQVSFGFVNRNVACTIATAGFAGFMFGNERLKIKELLFLALLFATVLYGGSRNALVMCILIVLVRYGLSFRIVMAGALSLFFMFFVLPEMGVEITALDRLLGTFDGTVSLDREEERAAAWEMIAARPWTGWGYSYANLSTIDLDMNAHNGYLTTIENLGWPCGLLILGYIIVGSLRRLKLYFLKNRIVNYHLAIILSTLFGANQEDYLVGVNQCTTNLFFLSFAVLGVYMYNQRHHPRQVHI